MVNTNGTKSRKGRKKKKTKPKTTKHPILQGCRIHSNWGKCNVVSLLGLIHQDSSQTLFYVALTYMYTDIKHKAISGHLLGVIMKQCILVFTLKDVSKNPFYLRVRVVITSLFFH